MTPELRCAANRMLPQAALPQERAAAALGRQEGHADGRLWLQVYDEAFDQPRPSKPLSDIPSTTIFPDSSDEFYRQVTQVRHPPHPRQLVIHDRRTVGQRSEGQLCRVWVRV